MAEMNVENSKNAKKGKASRQVLRVDFTPMVDMNMLLITFFMFCTTLSLPQVMDVVMPAEVGDDPNPAPESITITVLLGKDNKVYYYQGMPNYEDYTSLKETNFAAKGGIRDVILEKNEKIVKKMIDLKRQRKADNMSDAEFKKQANDIKRALDGAIVVIKATPESTYANLINTLDEMAICSVGRYAIVDLAEGDKYLLENYETKGSLTAQVMK